MELMLDLSNLLADFTATSSARPFDCGLYADDIRCFKPYFSRNSDVALAVNSGPPSIDNYSGAAKVSKNFLIQAIRPRALAWLLPVGVLRISGQPERRSPTIR